MICERAGRFEPGQTPTQPYREASIARAAHRIAVPGLDGLAPALVAVVLWSLAPALATLVRQVPPLGLTALCLAVAALVTWPLARRRGGPAAVAVPAATWVVAPLLLGGAIGLYFGALRQAPPAQVALVTYTWPVLFVLAAELVQARRVRPASLGGAALAFAGAGIVLAPAAGGVAVPWSGYALGIGSGCCWAAFSLLARHQAVPLAAIMPRLFALAALVTGAAHVLLEPGLWPLPAGLALTIALVGAGPYGLAFLAWDAALRSGRSALVGTLAYAVPVLSASLLVATGMASPDWRLPVAAAAVVAGCVVAGRGPRRTGACAA